MSAISHSVASLLEGKPEALFWIGFGKTPALPTGNDGWTKVGGGGNDRPKIRYSLKQLLAIMKAPECGDVPNSLGTFGCLKGGARQHQQNRQKKEKKVIILNKHREKVELGNRAENRWGGTGRMQGSAEVDTMKKVMNDINGILNKLSPPKNDTAQAKCQKLLEQLCVKLNGVEGANSADIYPKLIAIIMDKAANQEFFGQMYALVAKIASEHLGKDSGFAEELKKQVDAAFPRYTKGSRDQVLDAKAEREAEHKAAGKEGECKFSSIDQGDVEAKALAQHKGFMTFLGELHREQFNDVAYVDNCITNLLDSKVDDPDNERLTCAIKMLEAVGGYAKKQQMNKWIAMVEATKANRPMRFKLNIELLVSFRDKQWQRPKNDEKHAKKMVISKINYKKLRTEKAVISAPAAGAAGRGGAAAGPAGGAPGRAGSGAGGPGPAGGAPGRAGSGAGSAGGAGPAGGAPGRAGSGGADGRPPRMPAADLAAAPEGLKAVPPSPVMARASPDRGGPRGGGGAPPAAGSGSARPSPPHPLQQGGQPGGGAGPGGAGGPRAGLPPRMGGSGSGGPPSREGSGGEPPRPRPTIVFSRAGSGGGMPGRGPSREGSGGSVGSGPPSREGSGGAAPPAEPLSDRQVKNIVDDYLDGSEKFEDTMELLKGQPMASQDNVVKMVVEQWISGDKSKKAEQERCSALIEPMLQRKQASPAKFTALLKEQTEAICDIALDYPLATECMVEVISIGIRTNTIVLPIFTKDGTEWYTIPFAKEFFAKLNWTNEDLRKALGMEWLQKKAEEVLAPLPTRDM